MSSAHPNTVIEVLEGTSVDNRTVPHPSHPVPPPAPPQAQAPVLAPPPVNVASLVDELLARVARGEVVDRAVLVTAMQALPAPQAAMTAPAPQAPAPAPAPQYAAPPPQYAPPAPVMEQAPMHAPPPAPPAPPAPNHLVVDAADPTTNLGQALDVVGDRLATLATDMGITDLGIHLAIYLRPTKTGYQPVWEVGTGHIDPQDRQTTPLVGHENIPQGNLGQALSSLLSKTLKKITPKK